MTRSPILIGLTVGILFAVAAGSIANPTPGVFGAEPVDRDPADGGVPPTGDEPSGPDRPGVSVPGLGVTVPLPSIPGASWLFPAIVVLALLGGLVVWLREMDRRRVPEEVATVTAEDAAPDPAVADAAQRAASTLQDPGDVPADNAVYHAWKEMTAVLDVEEPDASTPREFATAALAADLPREEVATLTRLFEAVRYGQESVTDARRREAAAALSAIAETAAVEEAEDSRAEEQPDRGEDR